MFICTQSVGKEYWCAYHSYSSQLRFVHLICLPPDMRSIIKPDGRLPWLAYNKEGNRSSLTWSWTFSTNTRISVLLQNMLDSKKTKRNALQLHTNQPCRYSSGSGRKWIVALSYLQDCKRVWYYNKPNLVSTLQEHSSVNKNLFIWLYTSVLFESSCYYMFRSQLCLISFWMTDSLFLKKKKK